LGNFGLEPKLAQNFIPIATDWKSTDWLIANCYLQEKSLTIQKPIEDARRNKNAQRHRQLSCHEV
jgi:hypothetical protein